MKKIVKNYFSFNNILCLALILLIANNLKFVFVFIMSRQKVLQEEYFEPGYQFHTFKPFLKDAKTAGYVTNRSAGRESNDGAYLQAQYYLAPTLLQMDNLNNQYFIIDSVDRDFIIPTIRKTLSQRVANNAYGQALMRRMTP